MKLFRLMISAAQKTEAQDAIIPLLLRGSHRCGDCGIASHMSFKTTFEIERLLSFFVLNIFLCSRLFDYDSRLCAVSSLAVYMCVLGIYYYYVSVIKSR